MKNRLAFKCVWTATLLFLTALTLDIPFISAIEWSAETPLTTHTLQDMSPSIMQASDGTIWVVWVSNRMGFGSDEIFYKTSSNYGLSWSLDTRLTYDSSYDQSPSIMQASNGTIWVVWSRYRTGNYELFYKTFNGASWSSDVQLTTESSSDICPSIMQATNGLIWVVWHSDRTGNSELFYKTCNSSTWSTEKQLTDDPSSDQYPSILQAGNGTIWVVWSSYRTGNYELFYKTFNGAIWSYDTQLTNNPASYQIDPSSTTARDGTIWVVWQSGDIQDELYYKIYNGSAWSSEAQLTSDPANDIASSIAQINDRKIWVVWQADRDEDFDIYYKISNEIIIHDVAITNVAPSATKINQGEILSITVTVENQGDQGETFNVNVFANGITIGSTTVTLANGTSTQLIFSWDTAGFAVGRYNISATVPAVTGEVDTADNTFMGEQQVKVENPGDLNGDGIVNVSDAALISAHWYPGPPIGPSGYDPSYDINNDGNINVSDAAIVSAWWTGPPKGPLSP